MNYPVTTPYGQVPGYPLNDGFHNGIDYGYPKGTAVVVNGVIIGLSGYTGDVDPPGPKGAHLHVGKYVNGVVQNPGVGNGFSFKSAVVYDTGTDPIDGNYVRITGDGALWNYLHLQDILVIKGEVLKGDSMTASQIEPDETMIRLMYQGMVKTTPNANDVAFGKKFPTMEALTRHILASPEHANFLASQAKIPTATQLQPGYYKV